MQLIGTKSNSSLLWLWLSALVLATDRLTKVIAESTLQEYEISPVITGFFDFTLLYNPGAAFSFLASAGGWQRWLFSLLAVVMSVVLVIWIKRTPTKVWWLNSGLALILGGALGNLYDRVMQGQVVDFLSFHFGSYSFPAFNLADIAISCGAFLLIVDMLFFEKKRLSQQE
ncbi:MAG: signal peptidase II [Pseudomonadales bacterium]|nr:signal peptidase II [Pseudomonadales bacterium]NRA18193.1 lipoprotein signal peptidase [Oceanospirillaceae bacterium]